MTRLSPDASISEFIESIANLKFENVFNPYSDSCAIYDKPGAYLIRRRNLQLAMEAAVAASVQSIWLARDLGYKGGRRTGLAMTDDAHILAHASLLGSFSLNRATQGPIVAERTATVIWNALTAIKRPIFLWNVFPLHPHEPGVEMSNRLHTRKEREACRPLLDWLFARLKPSQVVAIGRDAQTMLTSMGVATEIIEVRHPSYGGQREFTESIQRLYGYSSSQGDLFA